MMIPNFGGGGSGGGGTVTKLTLKAASWTGTSAPYTYDLGSDYKDKAVVVSFDGDSGTTDQASWLAGANIHGGTSTKLYAYGRKPTVDIPVIVTSFG